MKLLDKVDLFIREAQRILPKDRRIPIIVQLREKVRPSKLRELEDYGLEIKDHGEVFNWVSGKIQIGRLDALKVLENVEHIFLNKRVRAMYIPLEKIRPSITRRVYINVSRASYVVNARRLYEEGYFGKGIRVAVLDTGVDPEHPTFEGAIEKIYDTVGTNGYDGHSHGTHVASTILGREVESPMGVFHGIAPEASLISIKVLGDNGASREDSVLKGMELAFMEDVDIINMSLGSLFDMGGLDIDSRVVDAISSLKNIYCCVAAGNGGILSMLPPHIGIWGSISSPGSARQAITVGSHACRIPTKDVVATYASKGPTSDGRVKPDILAPGGNILPGGFLEFIYAAVPYSVNEEGFEGLIGTSMATPGLSGCLALFLNYLGKERRPTSEGIKILFSMSARNFTPLKKKDNRRGYGCIDVARLCDAYESVKLRGIPRSVYIRRFERFPTLGIIQRFNFSLREALNKVI